MAIIVRTGVLALLIAMAAVAKTPSAEEWQRADEETVRLAPDEYELPVAGADEGPLILSSTRYMQQPRWELRAAPVSNSEGFGCRLHDPHAMVSG